MKLNFAENIRKLRRENGFTQEQLAEKIGVSNKTISKWENGKCMPDYSVVEILHKESILPAHKKQDS